MKQYMMDFPDELHREAKVKAAQEGITLKELIIKAMELYLKKGLKEKKSAGYACAAEKV